MSNAPFEVSKSISLLDVPFVIPDLDDIVPWVVYEGRPVSADDQLKILAVRRNIMNRDFDRQILEGSAMRLEAEAEGLLEQISRQAEIDKRLEELTVEDKVVPEAEPGPGFRPPPRSVEQNLRAELLPEFKRKGLYGALLEAQGKARGCKEKVHQLEYEITVFVSSLRDGPAEPDDFACEGDPWLTA